MAVGFTLAITMFSLARPFVLRSLPYANDDQLIIVSLTLNGPVAGASLDLAPTLTDWRAHGDLFDQLAAAEDGNRLRRVRTPSGAAIVSVRAVTDNFFDVLGVTLRHNAPWRLSDGSGHGLSSIVLMPGSRSDWSGDAALSYVDADTNESLLVVGRIDPPFIFPEPQVTRRPEAVTAANLDRLIERQGPALRMVRVIARTRDGVSVQTVRNRLAAPLRDIGLGVQVDRLDDRMTRSSRALAWAALLVGVLVVCASAANAASLMAVRTAYRAREHSIRLVLGATSADLVRQFALETVIVALSSLGVSLVLAAVCLSAISHQVPVQYLSVARPTVDLQVTLFALALCVFVSAGSATTAWLSARGKTRELLRGQAADPRRLRWLRSASLFGQTVTTMLLLVGAALLVHSFARLWSQDSGFSGSVAVATVSFPAQMPTESLLQNIHETVSALDALGPNPAAAIVGPFLDDIGVVGGYSLTVAAQRHMIMPREATPAYFETVGARLIAGRSLAETDRGWAAVVVDQTLARRLWPNRPYSDVVGETFSLQAGQSVGQVVGVVGDMYDKALDRPPSGAMFRPLTNPLGGLPVNFMLRLDDSASEVEGAVRKAVSNVNRDTVIVSLNQLDQRLGDTVRARTFMTLVLVCFTVAAIGVTASGLIGVVGFVVVRRSREIAIRRALGGGPGHVLRVVGGEAVGVAMVGSTAGLVLGLLGSRLLTHHLYGITPHDPLSFVMAVAVMAVVVAVAAASAARRALTVSPSDALRVD